MHQPDRPLPECLTRLLDAPAPRGPSPRPRGHPAEAAAGRTATGRGSGRRPRPVRPAPPRSRALEGVVLWALVYNVAGFVWLAILWQTLRWLAR